MSGIATSNGAYIIETTQTAHTQGPQLEFNTSCKVRGHPQLSV